MRHKLPSFPFLSMVLAAGLAAPAFAVPPADFDPAGVPVSTATLPPFPFKVIEQNQYGAIPLHGYVVVLERKAMARSLGFLDAAAMKQTLDADGRVALVQR